MEDNNKNKANSGKVWLVGAGPGDAGLFTIKGKKVLEQADVVVYDKLVGQGVLTMIPDEAETVFVGKIAGNHSVPQGEINEILLREAQKGKKVVRLKGGDPFLFGRGGEELELLVTNHIPFEIVPGITSAIAVPAYNGIPVTHRDFVSSLHIITGHTKSKDEAEIDYDSLVKLGGTFVFLMGITAMAKICEGLMAAGLDRNMPAAVLERGTRAHQRRVVSTVENLAEDAKKFGIKTPAIIVVGEVCSLEKEFHWAEDRPLGGMKIAVTRPKDRASTLSDKLEMLGAEVLKIPAVNTVEICENGKLDAAIGKIDEYDVIAFTSVAGVDAFFNRLWALRKDIRTLGNLKFAAVGPATASAVEKRGIVVDWMPEKYYGYDLGELLAEKLGKMRESVIGRAPKLLIPRASIGGEDILEPLIKADIDYEDIPVYNTIIAPSETYLKEKALIDFHEEEVDIVAFTSASGVRGFVAAVGDEEFKDIEALCIGEKTAEEARKYGMKVAIAEEATIDSMIDSLLAVKRKIANLH